MVHSSLSLSKVEKLCLNVLFDHRNVSVILNNIFYGESSLNLHILCLVILADILVLKKQTAIQYFLWTYCNLPEYQYLLYSPKKYIDNFENHNITRPGQGDDIINLTLKPHRRVFFFNLIPFFTEIKTYPPSSPLKKT